MGKLPILCAIIGLGSLFPAAAAAQLVLRAPAPTAFSCSRPAALPAARPPLSPVFLPKWSAETLPFFCKIEHNWAKKNGRIPMKFRLGSVDYVDWLEGKARWYKG